MNHGKNVPAQSFPEMVEAAGEKRKQSKLYRAESAEFVDGRIKALISKTAAELAEVATTEPVSLKDTEKVKERTMLYLMACQNAACVPTIVGLATSMGLSRQAIYDCIWSQSPLYTAKWLELCKDAFSNLLTEAALRGETEKITSIFVQKAVYGLKESIEIIAKNNSPLGPPVDPEELERRINANIQREYSFLPDDY